MQESSENESSDIDSLNSEDEEQTVDGHSSDDQEEDVDLDASSTESDEDDEEEIETNTVKSRSDAITETIINKYEERRGKQLYIRFPSKLPEDEREFQRKIQALSPLITKGHKPRQKHARFCLVDFNSNTDRDAALKAIKTAAKTQSVYKGLVASIPRTENEDFVKELAERKLKSLENKKAKARLKRISKLAVRAKNFTSSVVVKNIPKSASVAEVRKLFPNAVDIQIKPGKGKMNGSSVAAITLPSTLEARATVKQKLSLGGTQLAIRYNSKLKKQQHKPKVVHSNKQKVEAAQEGEMSQKKKSKTVKHAKPN